jgi:hypothetical protein
MASIPSFVPVAISLVVQVCFDASVATLHEKSLPTQQVRWRPN